MGARGFDDVLDAGVEALRVQREVREPPAEPGLVEPPAAAAHRRGAEQRPHIGGHAGGRVDGAVSAGRCGIHGCAAQCMASDRIPGVSATASNRVC